MIPRPSIHQDIARQRHADRLREAAQAQLAWRARLDHEPSERVATRLARLLRLRRARAAAGVEPTPAPNPE
jgi:hypothetical protein